LIVTNGVIGTVNGVDIQIFSSSISQVVTNIQTATGSQDGRLTSIESFTSSVSTTNTFTASAELRLNSIETISASNLSRIGSLETISASNIARINSLETTSASVDTINTAQNTRLTNLEIKTGSLATTGSNTFIGTQTITGSLFISSDLVVQGSSSLQNITASAVSIGTNIINLNTANPAIRYAGLVIGDSGSVGGSGSFLYDSVQDEMLFIHRGGSTVVTSSVALMGPETYDNLGNETYPTNNRIQKGRGNEHLGDSNISDNGSTIILNSNTEVSGSIKSTGNITAVDRISINKTNNTTLGASIDYDSAINQVYIYNHINGGFFSVYTNGEERLQISALGAATFKNSIAVSGASTFGSSTTNGDVTIISNAGPFQIKGRATYDRTFLALSWDTSPDAGVIIGNSLRFNTNAVFGTNTGTTAMTILADGKIGIGVTSPISQLHIRTLVATGDRPTNLATSATKSAVYFTTIGGSSAGIAFGQIAANTNYIQATYENGSASTPLSLNPYGGKVGIGTDAPDNSYQGLTIFGTDPSLRLKTSSGSGWVWTEYVTSAGTNNFSMGVNQTAPYFGIRAGAGMDNPQFRMDTSGKIGMNTTPSTNSQLNVGGSLRVNNSVYNWFQVGTNNWDGFQYLHLKTNMSSGANGNVDHTMSLFTGRLYSYSSAYIREGSFGFHNWSGVLYNPVLTGNFWAGGYSSSDGFVVLIVALGGGSYFGVNIDWHQSYPYGFRDRIVTSYNHSNSSSALY
jgi:hypothetical protein